MLAVRLLDLLLDLTDAVLGLEEASLQMPVSSAQHTHKLLESGLFSFAFPRIPNPV